MKWKICGMKHKDNILEASKLNPDYMGFIFYPPSPRNCMFLHMDDELQEHLKQVKKVGVFVGNDVAFVLGFIQSFHLDAVQLYSNDLKFLEKIKEQDVSLIKAISVEGGLSSKQVHPFEKVADYYLFDTKTKKIGGAGKPFNWKVLKDISLDKPFFLAGGIDIDYFEKKAPVQPFALDINSKFEVEPGLKDIEKLKIFQQRLFIENRSNL